MKKGKVRTKVMRVPLDIARELEKIKRNSKKDMKKAIKRRSKK